MVLLETYRTGYALGPHDRCIVSWTLGHCESALTTGVDEGRLCCQPSQFTLPALPPDRGPDAWPCTTPDRPGAATHLTCRRDGSRETLTSGFGSGERIDAGAPTPRGRPTDLLKRHHEQWMHRQIKALPLPDSQVAGSARGPGATNRGGNPKSGIRASGTPGKLALFQMDTPAIDMPNAQCRIPHSNTTGA